MYLWLKYINHKAEAPCRLFLQVLSMHEESSISGIVQSHNSMEANEGDHHSFSRLSSGSSGFSKAFSQAEALPKRSDFSQVQAFLRRRLFSGAEVIFLRRIGFSFGFY